jgi:hypothetical protein
MLYRYRTVGPGGPVFTQFCDAAVHVLKPPHAPYILPRLPIQ